MSHKLKSFLYFTCFLAAIAMYYSMDNNNQLGSLTNKVALVDADTDKISSELSTFEDLK